MAREAELARRLIERLVSDPVLRAEFRRDPVAVSRQAGLSGIAEDFLAVGGDPLETLELRESRSSLAGVVMAAAVEGVGISQIADDLSHHANAAPHELRASLAARRVSEAEIPRESWHERVDPDRNAGGGVGARDVAESPEGRRGARDVAESQAGRRGVRDVAESQAGRRGAGDVAEAHAAASNGSQHVDPDQYGMEGSGGTPSPETRVLLQNDRVAFDADGIADLKAGRIDPRVVSVLTSLSREHTIAISCMCSDHPKFSAGGSISNHYYGRGVDIATVDGQPVAPGNAAAKKVAAELARLNPSIRPSEIGSPWAMSGPAYFTDAAHQNHIHIGYDDPISRDWKPPSNVAADAPAATPSPAEAQPAAPDDAVPDTGDDSDDSGDTDDGDDGDDGDDADEDPNAREDGGSGDTEAEADDESDDDEDDEDEDDDEDDEDEDEDEPDEEGPDQDDLTDDEVVGDDSGDGSDDEVAGDDSGDGSDDDSGDGSSDDAGESSDSSGDSWQDPGVEVDGYPGDDAPREQVAAWMAGEARKRGVPPELPVMAGLVESGLRNLNFGDADSVGFFQMRVGIWNQGDYAGYPDRPELQLDWFLDNAEAVKKQRLAGGLAVDDPKSYGEWIADIERPAAQYRGRYQLQLDEARELLERAGADRASGGQDDAKVLRLKVIDPEEARRAAGGG